MGMPPARGLVSAVAALGEDGAGIWQAAWSVPAAPTASEDFLFLGVYFAWAALMPG